jgi:hypothetical protein
LADGNATEEDDDEEVDVGEASDFLLGDDEDDAAVAFEGEDGETCDAKLKAVNKDGCLLCLCRNPYSSAFLNTDLMPTPSLQLHSKYFSSNSPRLRLVSGFISRANM